MTTLEKLRKAFKKASDRYGRADARYKKAISNLYMPRQSFSLENPSGFVSVSDYLLDEEGDFTHGYATDYSDTFGTIGRNGRFYEKRKIWYQLRNLEHDLKEAEERRNCFLIVCNVAGINL